MKKVIVIGAGAAGLAAAARLQSEGYAVTLYEKEPQVGGKMNQVCGDGFFFDIGPTIVMMPDIYKEAFTNCGKRAEDYITMKKVEPMLTLNFSGEEPLTLSTDMQELATTLEDISQEDTQGYFAYLADIYKRYLVAKDNFIMRSFRKPTDFYNPKSLLAGFRLHTLSDAYTSISKFVKDERLRKSLAFQTLYIGISPYKGPSLYTMIPMIELFYGVWFIEGGMYAMAKGMEKLFLDLGGELKRNQPVEEIIIEEKKAVGVMVEGKRIQADYVVCNADFPYAEKTLIKEDKGKYTDQKIDSMEYSCSCFVLFLGLDKQYPVETLHTIRFAKNFQKNIDDIFEDFRFPDDPSFYLYVPSFADSSLAPEGKQAVYVLVPVPELSGGKLDWDQEQIQKYRNKVLDLVEKETVFSDIRQHIVFEDQFTPKDYKEHFNAYNGATFGLKPTLKQSNYWRPHNKYDYCDNLYFCGSSVHPGAGVPIVLTSAKLAAEELIKDDRA